MHGKISMVLDLPQVSAVQRIRPGVWRAAYADGRTYATVYAGRHPRSGEFDIAEDLATAQRREAEALRQGAQRGGAEEEGE